MVQWCSGGSPYVINKPMLQQHRHQPVFGKASTAVRSVQGCCCIVAGVLDAVASLYSCHYLSQIMKMVVGGLPEWIVSV